MPHAGRLAYTYASTAALAAGTRTQIDLRLSLSARTVESVRSLCHRLMGSLLHMWSMVAFARPRLPSLFSKSMGFTLCGIVDEPTCRYMPAGSANPPAAPCVKC